MQQLRAITYNIRSLSKHFDEFLVYLESLLRKGEESSPGVIILTETWVHSENIQYYKIAGFENYLCPRNDKTRSGGVMIYVKSEIKHNAKIITAETFQAIKITIQNTKKIEEIQIFGIYRDSRKTQNDFMVEYKNKILAIAESKTIITGDFNIDLLKSQISQQLSNIMSSEGFDSHINEPTRRGINKNNELIESCLDHLYTRNLQLISYALEERGITDHFSIEFALNMSSQAHAETKNEQETNKIITYIDRTKFKQLLQTETWLEIDYTSVDRAFESFIEIYSKLREKSRITREINMIRPNNKKRSPWITNETYKLSLLKKKNLYGH